jgi:hypothetical protein
MAKVAETLNKSNNAIKSFMVLNRARREMQQTKALEAVTCYPEMIFRQPCIERATYIPASLKDTLACRISDTERSVVLLLATFPQRQTPS